MSTTNDGSSTDAQSVARDLRYWIAQRATAQLTADSDASEVKFGSRVTVESDDGRRDIFRIVGMDEADPKRGTLSYVSPSGAGIDRPRGRGCSRGRWKAPEDCWDSLRAARQVRHKYREAYRNKSAKSGLLSMNSRTNQH